MGHMGYSGYKLQVYLLCHADLPRKARMVMAHSALQDMPLGNSFSNSKSNSNSSSNSNNKNRKNINCKSSIPCTLILNTARSGHPKSRTLVPTFESVPLRNPTAELRAQKPSHRDLLAVQDQ